MNYPKNFLIKKKIIIKIKRNLTTIIAIKLNMSQKKKFQKIINLQDK